jgi:hypothetical protein
MTAQIVTRLLPLALLLLLVATLLVLTAVLLPHRM